MLDKSTLGYARGSRQSLEVGVNLLDEWLVERYSNWREAKRHIAVLAVVALVAACCVPWLYEQRLSAANQRAVVVRTLAAKTEALQGLTAEQQRVQPLLDMAAIVEVSERRASAFVGEIIRLCNVAPGSVGFSTLRTDISGGQMTLRCTADAESSSAVQRFLAAAAEGPQVLASRLLSSRQSPDLGSDAVAFEYMKKAVVNP